jgi:ABC-type antimicrobial peptide transport system permease subunit
MTLVVRTSVKPQSLASTVQETVRSLDCGLPVSNVLSLEEVIADALWQPRFNLQLGGLLSEVAVLLAAVGLYSVMSYSVAQRTREVGIRLALGAGARDVLNLVVGEGLKLALLGAGLGLIAAAALTRLMAKLLFGVSATDPLTFAAVGIVAGGRGFAGLLDSGAARSEGRSDDGAALRLNPHSVIFHKRRRTTGAVDRCPALSDCSRGSVSSRAADWSRIVRCLRGR